MTSFFSIRKPHESPALKAAIDEMAFLQPYPQVFSRYQICIAMLAEPFLIRRGNPYLIFHADLSGEENIAVRQACGFRFYCLLEKILNLFTCPFLELVFLHFESGNNNGDARRGMPWKL